MNKFNHVGVGVGGGFSIGSAAPQVNKFELVWGMGDWGLGDSPCHVCAWDQGVSYNLWLTNGIMGSGHMRTHPVNRQTDTTENITFPQVVNIENSKSTIYNFLTPRVLFMNRCIPLRMGMVDLRCEFDIVVYVVEEQYLVFKLVGSPWMFG